MPTASWGSLHENAVYGEERRMTCGTRVTCDSLTGELPDDFQVVDTASCLSGQPPANGTFAEDLAGMTLESKP